ncbi:MAG TPA: hypothetical protein VHE80_02000, partial [Acidimicrobiales bacterium]|nr:hypothetical protein [Acidimicrobiales bacterium]
GTFFHLHFQPPLFNMVLAAARNGAVSAEFTLQVLFLGLGLLLILATFDLGRRLGFTKNQALGLAMVVSCNPTAVLFENHVFYAYPVAVLLVVATLLAVRYAGSRRLADGILFFSLLAVVILIRALYHPVWLLVAGVGLLVLVLPSSRRGVLLAAAGPLVIVGALFAKNLVLFGEPSSSTWFGMNASRATTFQIPVKEREALVRSGELSVLALRDPFEHYSDYADTGFGTPPAEPTGHPILDEPVKSNGGANFNYEGYLGIYRQYGNDARASVRLRPGAYLRGQVLAYTIYLNSPTDFFGGPNRGRISALDSTWRTVAYGQLPGGLTEGPREGTSPLVSRAWTVGVFAGVALVAVIVSGAGLLMAVLRRRRAVDPPTVGMLFAWATVVYVTLAANTVEVGENDRFRFDVEPLLLVMAACLARRAWLRRRGPAAAGD